MKKLLTILFCLLLGVLLTVGLASCDEGDVSTICQHRDVDDNSLCDKCSESYTDGVDVASPVHTHTWGEWSITVTPTCTTEGSHRRVCSGCPASEIETIPAAHTYDAENTCTRCLDYKDKGVVFVLKNYTCTVTDYTGNAAEVILPSKYMGSTVTSISSSVFENCSGLTSITIPSSVTSIGDKAFYNCSGLTSITIPNSVTSIGSYAFSGCSGLKTVIFAEGSKLTSIGASVFENCSELASITIPNSVTSIGANAFYGCDGLTSITIPNSVTSIGFSAFESCGGLKTVIFAEGSKLTSIGASVFKNCSELASITIPNSVASIGYGAFSGCNGIVQKENGVSYVDKWAIACDTSVTSITLRENTVGIGASAFSGCSGLTSITIPNSVTSIGASAFFGCSGLTSITIPNSVTNIGSSAFSGCSGLTSIKYRGTEAQWKAISKGSYWNSNTGNYTITYNYTGE